MTRLVNKFPVDLTGKNPNNAIHSEEHSLSEPVANGNLRVMIPNYGGFYTDTMILRNASGERLTPNDDYIASFLYENATLRSGMEVCGAIIVINPSVGSKVYLDYQVVGGDLAISTTALEEVLQALSDDSRPVEWGNIIGRPNTFPASGHLHALWELYGFEYVVIELERITQAIIAGYQPALDEVRAYALTLFNEGKDYTDVVDNRLYDHSSNYANPHQVTKAQVGLGVVENYPPSVSSEAESGTRNDRYMTPKTTADAIDKQAGVPRRQHLADLDNPHQVTKAQVGLGIVENYRPANIAEAESGVRNDRYMTPGVTKKAINTQIGDYVRLHTSNRNNPHQVTKAQVGLGIVENYPPSTITEGKAGVSSSSYMTPATTSAAIDEQAGELLNTHVSDTNNPHQVTKAQVGLGVVENYPIATYNEARSGSSNVRYMTPVRVNDLISLRINGLASKSYVDNAVSANSSLTAVHSSGSSLNLVSGGRYLISVYGYTSNRGNGGATLVGPGVKDSAGNWLTKCGNVKINWHDGSASQSATMYVHVSSGTGKVTGHADGGVLYMSAIRIG